MSFKSFRFSSLSSMIRIRFWCGSRWFFIRSYQMHSLLRGCCCWGIDELDRKSCIDAQRLNFMLNSMDPLRSIFCEPLGGCASLSLEQEFSFGSERGTMVVSDAEIERVARDLIAQWGRRAAHVAIEGLNKSIDLKDWSRRDMWVRVVRAI